MAKILLVDDAVFALNMIAEIVEKGGHSTVRATDGIEGLERIEEEEPDIVITDLLMPNLDGLSFLQSIRKTKPDLPIIIMSANIQKSVREKCLAAGAHTFIHKPPNAEELLAAIEGAL